MYNAAKQTVAIATVTAAFSYIPQKDNYASFYDDSRQNWSVRFDDAAKAETFARHIGLARFNVSAGDELIKQDLVPAPPESEHPVATDDACAVRCADLRHAVPERPSGVWRRGGREARWIAALVLNWLETTA